jgi:uncharacterized protein with HEPN domain
MSKMVLPIIADMLEAADAIREAIEGKSFVEFQRARVSRLAVQRAIEIISEASRRLPDDLIQRHPTLDWRGLRTIGNVLRHQYYNISDKVVWDAVHLDLPPLLQVLETERDTYNAERDQGSS